MAATPGPAGLRQSMDEQTGSEVTEQTPAEQTISSVESQLGRPLHIWRLLLLMLSFGPVSVSIGFTGLDFHFLVGAALNLPARYRDVTQIHGQITDVINIYSSVVLG
jgi:hypothetical protein